MLMQYRRAWPALVLVLLALLPLGALAADVSAGMTLSPADVPAGYGHVFPAPDPSDPVDVPPPFPAAPANSVRTRQFPATAEPQPTFAPAPNASHVYVAAHDSTMVAPNNTTVFSCNGAGDEVEIAAALAAAPGGVVELLDGTFRCTDVIKLAANTTLRGQGSSNTTIETVPKAGSTNGYLPISVEGEYVNVGGFTMRGNAFIMVRRSHVRVQDVRATCIDLDGRWRKASGNGMFFVWVAAPVTVIDDVEFYECHAVDCHTHGFNMNQDYTDHVARATTNIRFLDCSATRCGYGVAGDPGVPASVTSANQSRSEWITGFDFHEWQDLVNLEVVNCVASDNWESGFHLEPGARYDSATGRDIGPRTVSKNIVFRNCVSTNNGQRNTYASHFFMSGYYLSRDTHLYDCVSVNNRNCGYYVHGGAASSFDGCTDDGSTYGWKVCKASSDISVTDCTSANNLRWAMWLAFTQRMHVSGFRHTGVASDRGYQSILGWYKDESQYQLPVTDSSFEVTAVNNGMPILNQEGSGNTYSLSHEGTGGPVHADFTAVPSSGDAPLTVRFTDRSTGATLRWWDFGDKTISYDQNPVHTYAAPGNYTVTLLSANGLHYDAETKASGVTVMGPVTASFSATPTVVPVGGTVRFTSSSTGPIYTYAWDFGDNTTSTERNPAHVYRAAGTYDVSLTVRNTHFSNTRTLADYITVGEPVQANFTANRTAGSAPLAVAFTDTSSGGPTSWQWSFGDGGTSTARNPVHTYTSPGTYSVTLNAGNAVSTRATTVPDLVSAIPPPPVVIIRAVPPGTGAPTDTDADGIYDDVNGNGRTDFADVVLYFNQMTWIAANQPIDAFDCNGNTRIDFADVVWLFNHL